MIVDIFLSKIFTVAFFLQVPHYINVNIPLKECLFSLGIEYRAISHQLTMCLSFCGGLTRVSQSSHPRSNFAPDYYMYRAKFPGFDQSFEYRVICDVEVEDDDED
jgi:hypothetical protein